MYCRVLLRRMRSLRLPQPKPGVLPVGPAAPVIVVSPHFDDAVFSCWSVLANEEDADVVTIFTEGPDDDRVAPWDADAGVTSAERMAQRVRENARALAVAGCRAVNLGLLPASYGGGGIHHDLLHAWLTAAKRVYVPAGAGLEVSHPEHVVVRDACLSVRPDAHLYADNPYCGFTAEVDLPEGVRGSFERRVVHLGAGERARKAEAIRCYGGELPKLERIFGPLSDPDALVAEVFWAPLAA